MLKRAQVLKRIYENIGEAGSLSSPATPARVAGVAKKLVTEYLLNEPSHNIHRNQRVRGNYYRKAKVFFSLHILQAHLLTLNEIQRRYNSPYKYILLAISVFSCYAYAVPLRSKRGDEVATALI